MIELTKTAPAQVPVPELTFDIAYSEHRGDAGARRDAHRYAAAGVTFVSATDDGAFADGAVTWPLGNVGPGRGVDGAA
jgi:hypothetical protein